MPHLNIYTFMNSRIYCSTSKEVKKKSNDKYNLHNWLQTYLWIRWNVARFYLRKKNVCKCYFPSRYRFMRINVVPNPASLQKKSSNTWKKKSTWMISITYRYGEWTDIMIFKIHLKMASSVLWCWSLHIESRFECSSHTLEIHNSRAESPWKNDVQKKERFDL